MKYSLGISNFLEEISSLYHLTTGKTKALTRWTFVGKVLSPLFNILSRCVTALLSKSKCLLISWLQSSSAVILKLKKIKSATVSTFYPSICHEVMGPDTHLNSEFQRIPKRDKKAFLSDQLKEIVENNRMGKIRDFFKKIRDNKGTFHAKMATIKDRNGMDLTEAEDIKKRWQEHTEELYKKDLQDEIIMMV